MSDAPRPTAIEERLDRIEKLLQSPSGFDAIAVNGPALVILRPRGRLSAEAFDRFAQKLNAADLAPGIRFVVVNDCDVSVVSSSATE